MPPFKVRRKDREKNNQIKTAGLFVPYGFGNLHAKFQPSSSILSIFFIAPNIRGICAERKKNEKDDGQTKSILLETGFEPILQEFTDEQLTTTLTKQLTMSASQ